MKKLTTAGRRAVATAAAALLIGAGLQAPQLATADTAPPSTSTPTTASVDVLPTVQINGVAWTQLVIGNTVYVGGRFTNARPAGAAAGVSTTPRANLLAYNITTGNLISTWAPSTNGEVLSITASPDRSRIYIGGSFTTVNGTTRNRIAALNPTTGALISGFAPSASSTVQAIAANASTVYFGGLFTTVGGTPRSRVAAASASSGALLSWAPRAEGTSPRVRALAISPDGTKVLIGGSFTTMNGSSNPGYGMAAVNPTTGANMTWTSNSVIRNGGADAGITSFRTDGSSVYVTGFVFGRGGNLEGTARLNWSNGSIVWVEDCHGDTYESFPVNSVVYAVSHAHYCGNVPGGFPQTSPLTFHFGTAFTKAVTGRLKRDPLGYPNWEGTPAPTFLNWYPLFTTGSITGQNQAGWTVTGNSQYVAYGGEFPTVGGKAQQGLVRFAVSSIAPDAVGPVVTGARTNPTLTSPSAGTVTVSWTSNWDRDNESLTYSVMKNGSTTTALRTITASSVEWNRPTLSITETGLTSGSTVRYRIFTKDPFGNEVRSESVSIVVR